MSTIIIITPPPPPPPKNPQARQSLKDEVAAALRQAADSIESGETPIHQDDGER